jgi:hypothetical protein
MLTDAERVNVMAEYGADDQQVLRDHLISHVLAALSADLPDRLRFYGGTALSRTFLTKGRLSEDIDLIAVGSRSDIAAALRTTLTRRLARRFGRPVFTPPFSSTRLAQPVAVSVPGGSTIQLQLLPENHYPAWPFQVRDIEQRYADARAAALAVPTLAAFVAWKTATFIDRRAPRDLWDLAALAAQGAYSADAADLFRRFGPYTSLPTESTLPIAPNEDVWQRDLAHQTRLSITAEQARQSVLRAWRELSDDEMKQ